VWCLGQKKRKAPFLSSMDVKGNQKKIALTEINYDQTAIGLPAITSAVFFITKLFLENAGVMLPPVALPAENTKGVL
jgi:hypothetical protein